MNQVKTFVKNHQLALFFVLAYAFSWGNYWMLAAVNLVVAVVLVLLTGHTLKRYPGVSKESMKVNNLSATG